jgi:glycosyltransferase involved in cell wall biosynthesis
MTPGGPSRIARGVLVRGAHTADLVRRRVASEFSSADVSVFHQFAPAPGGGGNQFLSGLVRAFVELGLAVENNTISRDSRACLFNSFNFDEGLLRLLRRRACRMVHRVDGPVSVYRGRDDDTDRRVWEMNQSLADVTVFQSEYSRSRQLELGYEFGRSVVIRNAPDDRIFFAPDHRSLDSRRQVRLITTSWSDNPNKGFATLQYLDDNLDWAEYAFTFVGRVPAGLTFRNIRVVDAVPSAEVARLLREHDLFIFPSLHECCSNALVEALACGLPAVYVRSGSNAEVVRGGGIGFDTPGEIPVCVEQCVEAYSRLQSGLAVPSLKESAQAYLRVLGVDADRVGSK